MRKSKEQKLVHLEPAPLRPDSIRNRRRLFVFGSVRNFFLLAAAILPRAGFQGKRDNPKCFDSFGSCYNHLQENYSRLGNLVTNIMAESKHWQSLPVDLVFICKHAKKHYLQNAKKFRGQMLEYIVDNPFDGDCKKKTTKHSKSWCYFCYQDQTGALTLVISSDFSPSVVHSL